MSAQDLHTGSYMSPVGTLLCSGTELGLTSVKILKNQYSEYPVGLKLHPIIKLTFRQLDQYFQGKRKQFDIPLDFLSATTFYKSVWQILLSIPYGQTCSYGEIAIKLGDINKSRAVGMANGRNPIAIIVPCHRVIGSNNALTGYAGGLDVKQKLLELENPIRWIHQSSLF